MDNSSYEWRHAKGLVQFSKAEVETDIWGYYDEKLLSYYPKPLEWQFRDEYPMEDALSMTHSFGPNEWENINTNDMNIVSYDQKEIKTPEEFQKEIEELNNKYQNVKQPDMWENPKH